MNRRLTVPLTFLVIFLVSAAANATCVYPQRTVIDYMGWTVNGVDQCAAAGWGPGPAPGVVIGQHIIECDGTDWTWGTVCEPTNGYNQSAPRYYDCDCGPDQGGALRDKKVPNAKPADAAPAARSCNY